MLFISMDHRAAIVSPASKAVRQTMTDWLGAPIQRTATVVGGMGVCVFASVSLCARACVHECVRDWFAIYDNDILPRLIMISVSYYVHPYVRPSVGISICVYQFICMFVSLLSVYMSVCLLCLPLTTLSNIYNYPTIGPNERERSLSLMENVISDDRHVGSYNQELHCRSFITTLSNHVDRDKTFKANKVSIN